MKCFIYILLFTYTQFLHAETKLLTCTHPEICKLLNEIIVENQFKELNLKNAIIPSGDPHEFEPSSKEIKELIQAEILINGPMELNPWMSKVQFLRTNSKDIYLKLDNNLKRQYPNASLESLSHFWLYPEIYCQLKRSLEVELKNKLSINSKSNCQTNEIEQELQRTLSKFKLPIIITHDALAPLIKKYVANPNEVIALKGSSHHEETSLKVIKSTYDILKKPHALWIIESDIALPSNLANKIRKSDFIIKLATKTDYQTDRFYQLKTLVNEISKIK